MIVGDSFDNYQTEAYKFNKVDDTSYHFLGLASEAGEACDLLKKFIRDGGETLNFQDKLKKELGDVLWYVSAIAHRQGWALSDIAQTNIDKLSSRNARGVIGGSGDNR